MAKTKQYFSLLVQYERGDKWAIAFGDYKKETVKDERDDAYEDCHKTRIIRTDDNQQAINYAVAQLNQGV